MTIDTTTFVIVTVLSVILGLVVLYFVVKAAIRNALIEDRAFQAKVQKIREQR